jgi:hypothetical protein
MRSVDDGRGLLINVYPWDGKTYDYSHGSG